MVFDPERGCVRGRERVSRTILPPSTEFTRRLEEESSLWADAIPKSRTVPLLRDLVGIYASVLQAGDSIEELPLEKEEGSLYPGFSRFRIKRSAPRLNLPSDVAYRCGSCRVITAGKPNIGGPPMILQIAMPELIGRNNSVYYSCTSCEMVMLNYRGNQNVCRGFEDPSIDLGED